MHHPDCAHASLRAPASLNVRRGVSVSIYVRSGIIALLIAAVLAPIEAQGVPAAVPLSTPVKQTRVRPLAAENDGQVLPSGPVTGTVDAIMDPDDLFAVALEAGDELTLSLTGPAGSDFDLYLLWPGTSGASDFDVAAAATSRSYPDAVSFDVAQGGSYVLDVHALSGSGSYTLTWSVAPATSDGVMDRWFGSDRYATAIDTSRNTFADGSSHDAVIASGASFADSLTAVGLAGALRCPLLLTKPTAVPGGLLSELTRLGVKDVHIVGGPKAVSDGVATEFVASGMSVYRYGGTDRYDTATKVAREVVAFSAAGTPELVFVARGDLFPDALVVAPVSYAHGYPVILTRPDALPAVTASIIDELRPPRVIIAGGVTAVTAEVAAQIDARPSVVRVDRKGGSDRYETAALIARWAAEEYRAVPAFIGVACGTNYPDALAGGAATGAWGGVVLLTKPTSLSALTRDFIDGQASLGLADRTVVFGGTVAVSDAVYGEIGATLE